MQINILAFMSNNMFAKSLRKDSDLTHWTADQKQRSLKFSIYFGIANHMYVPH
jgi:hypothetical protein